MKSNIEHYSMPKSIAKLIAKWSDIVGMNRSEFVREAVRRYVRYLKGQYGNRAKA